MCVRSTKVWNVAVLIGCISVQGAPGGHVAQKQADVLWYKTVQVKRVTKANRRVSPRQPKNQILPLLTLQYRVLKRLKGGRKEEVDSQSVFETGDQVKIGITPNQNGYLYFILTNSEGGLLRNDRIFVTKNTEYLAPSVCPGQKGRDSGYFFEFAAPAPTSGVEEIVIIFSRNLIKNLPNNCRERVSLISRETLNEIKSRSGQILEQMPGKIERLLRGAPGRFATLAQNTNTEDNEELVVTLPLKHPR
jgi:hypothetical protein